MWEKHGANSNYTVSKDPPNIKEAHKKYKAKGSAERGRSSPISISQCARDLKLELLELMKQEIQKWLQEQEKKDKCLVSPRYMSTDELQSSTSTSSFVSHSSSKEPSYGTFEWPELDDEEEEDQHGDMVLNSFERHWHGKDYIMEDVKRRASSRSTLRRCSSCPQPTLPFKK